MGQEKVRYTVDDLNLPPSPSIYPSLPLSLSLPPSISFYSHNIILIYITNLSLYSYRLLSLSIYLSIFIDFSLSVYLSIFIDFSLSLSVDLCKAAQVHDSPLLHTYSLSELISRFYSIPTLTIFSMALSYIKFVTLISTYLFYVFAQLFLSSMKDAFQLMEARAKRVAMRTREDWLRGKSKNIADFAPISLFKFLTTTVSKFFFRQCFILIYDPTHFFTLLYLIPLVISSLSSRSLFFTFCLIYLFSFISYYVARSPYRNSSAAANSDQQNTSDEEEGGDPMANILSKYKKRQQKLIAVTSKRKNVNDD